MDDSAVDSRRLTTVREVIAALGGLQAVSDLTGRGKPACSMWQTHGRIPPRFFSLFKRELRYIGRDADDCLWGQ
jgi:hypothetical protein